jgi:metal-sulfur cluster biosynthetic enzyme
MVGAPTIELPSFLDQDTIIQHLDRVLDPELDESIVELGFVQSIRGNDAGDVTVDLRLPTYWCAANFSYLMAFDVRLELLKLSGVRAVTVRLEDHFASDAILSGIAPGKSFGETFPEGGPDSLDQTRDLFLRKGYFTRQEVLLRHLKTAGLAFDEIAALRIGDIRVGDTHSTEMDCSVVSADGQVRPVGEAKVARRYLDRRAELGLDCTEEALLIVDISGATIPVDELETYYVRARTARLAMEANGSLCSALLEARNSARAPIGGPEPQIQR